MNLERSSIRELQKPTLREPEQEIRLRACLPQSTVDLMMMMIYK